ncbi:MAG: sugar-binding protein [Bacillota bacterium]|nr:sugar-binding protein [Bacillota bacterium]
MRMDPEHPWFEIGGLDYIRTAFNVAHRLDPSLQLYINDYGTENNNTKTTAEIELIKELLKEGIPVGGIGMQMHMDTNTDMSAIKASIEKFAALGLPIQVTELDLGITDSTITQASYSKQAIANKQFFDVLKSEKQYISAVLFWGVTDNDSWRASSKPLIFDAQYQAKPAYWAIVDPSKVTISRQGVQAVEGTPAGANDVIWSTVKPLPINTYAKGISGATGNVRIMWDSNNLYIKATVTDATFGSNDSIDIYLDKADSKAESYQPDANYKHLTIKRSDAVSDANGYTVFKTIPINDITPALNGVLGFDARVNDDQGTGTVVSQAVFNDYGNRQDTNAAYFGDLKLGGPSKLANAIYGTPTVVDETIDIIWNNVNGANTMITDTWQQGTSGATAKVKTMWDDKNLYVLAEVTDSLLNKDSANPWEQDSVEVFLDQNNHKTSSYEGDDYQIRVNYDNEQSGGTNGIPSGFKSVTKRTDSGYVVVESIPLTTITISNGTILGFDVQVNNADNTGKRVSTVSWSDPTGNGWASTVGWGNLLLVKPVTGVTLDKTTASVNIGDTLQLTATVSPADASNKSVIWHSDDESIAKVDDSGKVTTVGVGTADITVTTVDGSFKATCTVTVNPIHVTGISLNKNYIAVTKGDSIQLKATITPKNATDQRITWKSDNEKVAVVDANGKVTALHVGKAKITATTVDGKKTAVCEIQVAPNDTSRDVLNMLFWAIVKFLC